MNTKNEVLNKILILFAHPKYEKSRINQSLIKSIPKSESITLNDLYENYPDFNIDVEKEKDLLLNHDIIIWQHPFYWYNAPPLLKQWIDMVLEFEWAYGPGGNALSGKYIFNVMSTGGTNEAYQKEGRNRFTIKEFLAPFDQTAYLCKMIYLPPFLIQGTHRLTDKDLKIKVDQYRQLLVTLLKIDLNLLKSNLDKPLNEWIESLEREGK